MEYLVKIMEVIKELDLVETTELFYLQDIEEYSKEVLRTVETLHLGVIECLSDNINEQPDIAYIERIMSINEIKWVLKKYLNGGKQIFFYW